MPCPVCNAKHSGLDNLELSVRATRVLANLGITTPEQLISFDFRDIETARNCGVVTLAEIACRVVEYMQSDEWTQNMMRKALLWDKVATVIKEGGR